MPSGADIEQLVEDIPGYLITGQASWLYQTVANLPNDAVIVEIGSYLGKSTAAMALACRGTRRRIYAIDTFAGNVSDFINGKNGISWEGNDYLHKFKENLNSKNLLDYVEPIQADSIVAGKVWDKQIDFLFIDGSHEFDMVKHDFEVFGQFVRQGGIIALHDVLPNWDGPYRFWNEEGKNSLESTGHFFSIAFGTVGAELETVEPPGDIHVIIPVHNRINLTKQCLKSLATSTLADKLKIHVVDDGSTDGTSDYLSEERPDIDLIEGDGSLFWTGAVYKALETIRFGPNDYFLLVNNDSLVSAETIEILLEAASLDPKLCIAPICFNGKTAEATGWGPGSAPILNNFALQQKRIGVRAGTLDVDVIFGRCSLFPASILSEVGNYDAENFKHYHGDTDYCLRATKAGYRFQVSARTTISCVVSNKSTGSHHDFRLYPQRFSKVWENMTSIRSIDNVPAMFKFAKRHHPKRKYRFAARTAWTSLRQWEPIFKLRGLKRKLAGQRPLIEGQADV